MMEEIKNDDKKKIMEIKEKIEKEIENNEVEEFVNNVTEIKRVQWLLADWTTMEYLLLVSYRPLVWLSTSGHLIFCFDSGKIEIELSDEATQKLWQVEKYLNEILP